MEAWVDVWVSIRIPIRVGSRLQFYLLISNRVTAKFRTYSMLWGSCITHPSWWFCTICHFTCDVLGCYCKKTEVFLLAIANLSFCECHLQRTIWFVMIVYSKDLKLSSWYYNNAYKCRLPLLQSLVLWSWVISTLIRVVYHYCEVEFSWSRAISLWWRVRIFR